MALEIPNTYESNFTEFEVKKETKLSLNVLKNNILTTKPFNIREKPIDLWYKEINKEKKISIDLPDKYSAKWRILRCMRWKAATDAVEDKYNIPRWLLLAMMAQEWMGDPTMPNLWWDGGLWLIHIQAANAADFWLKTLPRYTTWMRDTKHGKEINKVLDKYDDVKKLISYDDRFHPIIGLDCSARFLKNVYNSTEPGKDRRVNALRKYSWRALNDYLWPVVKYWVLTNTYTWDPLPDFSKNTNNEIIKMKSNWSVTIEWVQVPLDIVQTSAQKLSITIDNKPITYKQYIHYTTSQLQNYWLKDYITYNPKEKKIEQINNLQYLNKSRDKQRNIYKYTIDKDMLGTNPQEFVALQKAQKKFIWKTIEISDADGVPLVDPLNFPNKKWDVIYIREKIQ